MAQALPLTKLATLLVKTLSKPVSKRIKHEFSRYSTTRNMLIGIGQASHAVTSRMTIWSAGYRVKRIAPLEEEKALSTGAEFVGESFVLIVSAGTVIWEYNRSQTKAREKEEASKAKAKAEREALRAKLKALDVRVKALEDVVKKNSQSLLSVLGGQQVYVEPADKDVVPIVEDDDSVESKEAATGGGEKAENPPASNSPSEESWWQKWKPW